MKLNRNILITLSLILICTLTFNLTSCTRVQAEDLSKGVTANSVPERQPDDSFKASQIRLAVELFKASSSKNTGENLLISPLSIQLALAMTANGANGKTKQEMEQLLGGEISLQELNEYLHTYVESLPDEKDNKLKIANSIWFRDDKDRLTVEKDFLQTNANYYNAQIFKSAFDGQTLKDINNWIDINTDSMIDNALNEIDPNSVMYLINALMFDARWQTPYEKDDVYDGEFTSASKEKQSVKMMRSEENLYLNDGSAKGFVKNYKNYKYSIAALLPNEGVSIDEYIRGLTAEGLMNTLQNAEHRPVSATIPKFSYEYSLNMKDVLRSLGINSAFDPISADFSKMTSSKVHLDQVIHKTFISVDERGTKAGAVTIVELKDTAVAPMPITVVLDRPFVYMIIDNSTNLPIFIGATMSVK
ncbi:MAG: serpin family protein [Clostridia bacterium]|nr:serpin family protein [Clostridia bacterium]